MDAALQARLLAPEFLGRQIAQHAAAGSGPAEARLVSAAPRAIEGTGYVSDLTGVDLAWSAQSGAPTRAVLKVSHPRFGIAELPFYRDVAAGLQCPALPGFYAGGTDAPTGRVWVLLEDLSGTHESPSEEPVPPSLARCRQVVEALAQFHAAGRSYQGPAGQAASLAERLRTSQWLGPAAERLFAQVGDALPAGARALYGGLLAALPALAARVETIPATLAHGDAHVWNAMLPRAGAGVGLPAKLVDWEGWHLGIGAWDLAYMMAVQWDREVRQRLEMPLLDHYHRALLVHGVTHYPRDALQQDYRLAVLLHLRSPVTRYELKMSAWVWWPQLTRVLQAVEDLGCGEWIT
jgi:hypothetical protein